MQISDNQTDESSLAAFGAEVVRCLCSGDIPALADRFGYALAFDREPATAIREDLASCLAELHADSLAFDAKRSTATVKYFEQNDSGLYALIECLAPTDNGTEVLVELMISVKGPDKYVNLEQLSVAA